MKFERGLRAQQSLNVSLIHGSLTSTVMSFLSRGLLSGSGHFSPRQRNREHGGHSLPPMKSSIPKGTGHPITVSPHHGKYFTFTPDALLINICVICFLSPWRNSFNM